MDGDPGRHAEALAADLAGRGFTTVVFSAGQHKDNPVIRVTGRSCIYVAEQAGEWWYFSAALQPVAPCRLAGLAAALIAAWPAPVWVPLYRAA